MRSVAGYLAPQFFLTTPLEQELIDTDAETNLFQRYGVDETVQTRAGPVTVHTVQAPQPDAKRIVPLPAIVLVHGLGGQISSFRNLGEDVNRLSSIVIIDLPGHGKSPDPESWDAVSPEVSVEIIEHITRKVCGDAPIVLIGHSYGCCHVLRAATKLKEQCKAVVAITPPFRPDLWTYQRLISRYFPVLAFDLGFRSMDRKGELHSPSVNRSVAKSAGDRVRRQQLQINLQSRSATVLQTISRAKFYDPAKEEKPECNILVIGASEDQICPIQQARDLNTALEPHAKFAEIPQAGHSVMFEQPEITSGVISHFLQGYVDERLSMTWRLQYLSSREDKWSLKNEKKWLQTEPVGNPVDNSAICGMKVLRENDPIHGPFAFEKSHPKVKVVIDISRETPPYDPGSFEHIKYIKFPTVSKIPPQKLEVSKFIELVNSIKPTLKEGEFIAVHCHYGFNRTGFFICSYLIEELGYNVSEAVAAYAKSRPPGIKHSHFIDELHLRYSMQ